MTATAIPSGPGQTTKDKSQSIVHATDDPALELLQAIADAVGASDDSDAGQATAARQDTGNTSLSSIDTKLTSQATATKQDTGNTSLSSMDTKLTSQATAANQTTELGKLDSIITNTARLAPLGPGPGSATGSASKIFGFAFAVTTAANFDLTLSAYAGLKTAIDSGKLIILKATAGCYYNWATANITIAAASTAASNPATQGIPMFDGGESPERVPSGTTVLNILGGAVAGTLYAYIAE